MNEREVVAELMEELQLLATSLALDRIEVTGGGHLDPSLQQVARRIGPTDSSLANMALTRGRQQTTRRRRSVFCGDRPVEGIGQISPETLEGKE